MAALDKYIQYRKEHGEAIYLESPLFRDKFDPLIEKENRISPMTAPAIRQYYNRLLFSIGVRKHKKRRHEFSVHSLRKWFKTRCEIGGMKPINVETLLNHSTGISDSYYRVTESELLSEYENVIDHLSISMEGKLRLELESQTKRNKEIESMKEKYEQDMKEIHEKMNHVMEMIQENPELANAKPEALTRRKKH